MADDGRPGGQALKQVWAILLRAFPDIHITMEDLITEGDEVVARQSVTGTHQGDYIDRPPTGKSITYNEIFIVRSRAAGSLRPGVVNVLSQMRQLGVIPGGFS